MEILGFVKGIPAMPILLKGDLVSRASALFQQARI